MTTIAIVPERAESDGTSYRAVAGGVQSVGRTAGEALDALMAQLRDSEAGPLIVLLQDHADSFFTVCRQEHQGGRRQDETEAEAI